MSVEVIESIEDVENSDCLPNIKDPSELILAMNSSSFPWFDENRSDSVSPPIQISSKRSIERSFI